MLWLDFCYILLKETLNFIFQLKQLHDISHTR